MVNIGFCAPVCVLQCAFTRWKYEHRHRQFLNMIYCGHLRWWGCIKVILFSTKIQMTMVYCVWVASCCVCVRFHILYVCKSCSNINIQKVWKQRRIYIISCCDYVVHKSFECDWIYILFSRTILYFKCCYCTWFAIELVKYGFATVCIWPLT